MNAKPGNAVRILKPHGLPVEDPIAILIARVEFFSGQPAWRALCDDRLILLFEEEFEILG